MTDRYPPVLLRALDSDLPEGVTAQLRTDGERKFVFLMNFSEEEKTIRINVDALQDVITGEALPAAVTLRPYGVRVMKETD